MLSTGASGSITTLLKMLVNGPQDGIMIPIPQYPLYSACLAEFNATIVPYYLNEETNWSLNLEELERQVKYFYYITDLSVIFLPFDHFKMIFVQNFLHLYFFDISF